MFHVDVHMSAYVDFLVQGRGSCALGHIAEWTILYRQTGKHDVLVDITIGPVDRATSSHFRSSFGGMTPAGIAGLTGCTEGARLCTEGASSLSKSQTYVPWSHLIGPPLSVCFGSLYNLVEELVLGLFLS